MSFRRNDISTTSGLKNLVDVHPVARYGTSKPGDAMLKQVLAAALLLTATSAFAQEEDPEEREFNINQFKGWTGVVLRCVGVSPDKAFSDAICAAAEADFKFMAETAGIPYRIVIDQDQFQLARKSTQIGHPIVLQVTTYATGANGPIGVHIGIQATSFYGTAVESDAKPGDPEAMPKAGDLVLWEKPLTAAGGDYGSLARDLSPHVGRYVKEFFSTFLPGWKSNKGQ